MSHAWMLPLGLVLVIVDAIWGVFISRSEPDTRTSILRLTDPPTSTRMRGLDRERPALPDAR